jgi:DNA end-binding protein Ku
MAARSSWKGFLKISLVSVPVKAYTATASGASIALNQLHSVCHSRIKYQKVCPIHGEVPSAEIVSGYEFAKGQYAVIDTDELEKLRTDSDKSINVDQFVSEDEIDTRYLTGACYFLVPDGPVGQKAYAIVRDVMNESQLRGVAQIILFGKEQLVLLQPVEKLIGMFVLRHADEVKQPSAFDDELGDAATVSSTSQELKLTKQLMEGLQESKFDIGKYSDTYTERLTALIQSKVEGKELVTPEATDEPQVINLMDALKASIERVGTTANKAPKKVAPSKPTRTAKTTTKATPAKTTTKASTKKRKSG